MKNPKKTQPLPRLKKTIPMPEPKIKMKKAIPLPEPKLKSNISGMKRKGESGAEMERRIMMAAFNKDKKPSNTIASKKTTRKVLKEPVRIEPKKAKSLTVSDNFRSGADRKVLYGSYDLGFRRKNMGGQENPTPFPTATPRKKSKKK